MQSTKLSRRITRLRKLMAERFGARGSLAEQLAKVGSAVPRDLRPQADLLARVEPLLAHPKLAMQVPQGESLRAARALERWLRGVNPMKRRMDALAQWLITPAFGLLTLGLAVLLVLRWRGIL